MKQDDLKIINAINILATAKIDALFNIEKEFKGEWSKAWQSDLRRFLPADLDYEKKRKKVDPELKWQELLKQNIDLVTINDSDYPSQLK